MRIEWLLCPICKSKTRLQLREDTELKNFPLYVLKEDGYPDVQAFMATYRKAEAVVEKYNRELAAWERQVKEKRKPPKKEQAKPPERESVLERLRQLQAEGKQRNQPRQRRKSFDRDSR